MKFVEYHPKYKEACLELLKTNIGSYFAAEEFDDYEQFLGLSQPTFPYYVLLDDEQIVGAGGFEIQKNKVYLRWGIINKQIQGQGLGSLLLKKRIEVIQLFEPSLPIHIYTSPMAQGFYEKHGFLVESIEKDGLVQGIDKVNMKLKLIP